MYSGAGRLRAQRPPTHSSTTHLQPTGPVRLGHRRTFTLMLSTAVIAVGSALLSRPVHATSIHATSSMGCGGGPDTLWDATMDAIDDCGGKWPSWINADCDGGLWQLQYEC